MIGKRLNDRYKLIRMIGGGGMANVYLARDVILERDVAVKILRLDYSNNEEFIKRFHREAQSVTTLSHPNIVNIYDVGEEDGIYYLVMEYVDGQTLKQYIQQKGMLSVKEALDIMEQLTSAMAHAHHFEIVHRDIKPQNILVGYNGEIKVTDFGIATATSATTITHTNSVLGSVHYLSPEQARGGVANKQSDIYSLGIVMFELLTGRPPFSGESAVSIALKHLQNDTPSPKIWNPDIPQSVENIVLHATAKDTFHRYSSADEMRQDIETALYPERANEKKFIIPEDNEATRAIPIIKQENFADRDSEDTIVLPRAVESKGTETVKNEPEKKKRFSLLKILLAIFLLLTGGGILAVTVIPDLFMPKNVTIPDVSGLDYDKAVTVLANKGFHVTSPKLIYDDTIEEGIVIKTDPVAGRIVKENSSITIYKSAGKEKKKMENFIGLKYDQVMGELKNRYLSVEKFEEESDKPEGEIIRQSPDPDTEIIEKEQKVLVWVSQGPKEISLMDVKGWAKSSVETYAVDKNLNVEWKTEYSDTITEGYVISQSPKAGTKLKEEDSFSVTISMGPKEQPPETVKINVSIPYEPDPEKPNAPQTVEVYKEDMEHTMAEPVETRSITSNITLSIELVIPYGKKAKYKIVRDGVTIVEKEVPYPSE
nr:Stk1 family PASTA domain-containing Ser/Thr kinase [Bacillus sp. 165]